jgi:acetylornithine deacetylase/succinyl-diaminopimelate desuccinylase-like protein
MGEEPAVATQKELGAATVQLLQRLIRIDTSNPPGDERPAQEMLRDVLAEVGFDCELVGRTEQRPNLVARLRGEADGPTLCLLGHADTVPAEPSEWSRGPWSGELVDDEVWGRGALDMKGQVAAEVAAAAALASGGWRPAHGELLVVTTADEEAGAAYGARWLCEERPELVRSDFVVNEGGGVAIERDGRRLYTISLGEKGVFRLTIRAHGRSGHGSLPRIGDNALLKLGPLLERLASQPDYEATPEGVEFLSAMLGERVDGDHDSLASALERLGGEDPAAAMFIAEPILGVTLTPTMTQASLKENVIPSHAELFVDCRVPPGYGEDDVRERVESVIGEGDWEIEFSNRIVGNRSEPGGELWDAISDWVGEADPGAELAPMVMPGFSDSHWFREAFGCTVYGFCPHSAMTLAEYAPLIHSADERVAVPDLALSARFFAELPPRLLG